MITKNEQFEIWWVTMQVEFQGFGSRLEAVIKSLAEKAWDDGFDCGFDCGDTFYGRG